MEIEEKGNRLLLTEGGETLSWLEFDERDSTVEVTHVFTPKEKRGRGYASRLVERGLPILRERGELRISCPYVKRWAEEKDYPGDLRYTPYLRFREAVRDFNRYHAPEAVAEILSWDGNHVTLEMTGSFCRTCGAYDYLEDVIVDVEAEVESHEEIENGFRAVYRLGDEDKGRGRRVRD